MSIGQGLAPFAALERSPLFARLEREALSEIAAVMEPLSYAAGDELCRAGERAKRVHVIASGLVRALAPAEGGAVATRRVGEVIGAASVLTGEPHPETVVATMPTETLSLGRDRFEALLDRWPDVRANVLRIVYRRFARSLARGARERERGEAVALILAPGLAAAADALVGAAKAASPQPVAALDTRTGFEAAVAQLDDLLPGHGTVLVIARAAGRSAPLLFQHVDRAVAIVEQPEEAGVLDEARGDVELQLVVVGEPATPGRGASGQAIRVIERESANEPAGIPPSELAWLGRHLTRTKIGLALGAGGAKGFAHVGALQVLEQAGYEIDFVSGASIGAIVATFIALGMRAGEVEQVLRTTFAPEVVSEVFQISLAGTSTGLDHLRRLFQETTGGRSFDETVIPLAMMSVDLNDRGPAPIREGTLWEGLLAATALAGIFPPQERDGQRLVDGVALVPVPTEEVLADGADVTISVNLMSRETLDSWPGDVKPSPEPPRRAGSRLLETLLEVMDLTQLDESVRHAQLADVVVTPRFAPCSWRDFHLADLFLQAGRRATEEQLPELRALARPRSTVVST
jgi:NTE family protein